MGAGLATLIVGLALFTFAVVAHSAPAFLGSAAVLGAGHGLAYLGAQELTDSIAPPDRRAQIFSAFQLGLYGGATLPALLLGFAAGRLGLTNATLVFAGVVAAWESLASFGSALAPYGRHERNQSIGATARLRSQPHRHR